MNAHLAVLRQGGLSAPTLESLIEWLHHRSRCNWSFAMACPDAAVDRSRGIIASNFLRATDCEVLVMMDYDIQLTDPGDLDYLAEKAAEVKGIVGAVVPCKGHNAGFGCRFVDGVPHEMMADELVELTPKNIRMRKKILTDIDRRRQSRRLAGASSA